MNVNMIELQKWLVEQLPETIRYDREEMPTPNDGFHYPAQFTWVEKDDMVRDTEWDYIVWLVEAKVLKPKEWQRYSTLLMRAICDSDLTVKGSNIEARYKTPHADWRTRTTALIQVLAERIKPTHPDDKSGGGE